MNACQVAAPRPHRLERAPVCGYKPPVTLRVLLVFALCLAASCGAQPGVCGVRDEVVVGADGGSHACAGPEECPLPSNTYLCVTDLPLEAKGCMACLDSRCVRRTPEACR